MIFNPKLREVKIHLEGTRVLLLAEGRAILDLPWDVALKIGRGMVAVAHKAEEMAKAPEIIADQALLMRTGFPIGLTSNPGLQKEAAKEAAWNRELRRAIPSIGSREVFGTPALIQKPPTQKLSASGIVSEERFGKIGG